jgi:hypothetical protein
MSSTARFQPNSSISSGKKSKNARAGAQERHHAEHERPAWPGDAKEVGQRRVCFADHVAERAADADDCVKLAVPEAREVDDVEEHPVLDRRFDLGRLLAVELQLARRDISDNHAGADVRQLQGEAPGPGACLEHAVAAPDELAHEPAVDLEIDAIHRTTVEPLPFALAVRVVEAGDVLGVVPHLAHGA